MRRGFSLVEMIVVIAITMTLMAMLLPGIALAQKKSDQSATTNVIQAVHDIQVRNARQFGSAGMVYGYTIRSDRRGIEPWVILPGGGTTPTAVPAEDIGSQMFWQPGFIEFVDNVEPKSNAGFSVSFEPRTGFAHTGSGAKNLGEVSNPTTIPTGGTYDLRSRRSPWPTMFEIRISGTGVMSVHGKR